MMCFIQNILGAVDLSRLIFVRNESVLIAANAMQLSHSKSALRNQGMNADAVTIDAPALDKKIVYLLHDEKPNTVDVAFGNKEGDINASSVIELSNVTQESVLRMMELNFLAFSRCE